MKQRSFHHYPYLLVFITGILTFFLVIWSTKADWYRIIFSWTETDAAIRDSIFFAGPIASLLTCVLGALHRTVSFTAVAQRKEWKLIFARLIPQFSAVIVGWICGLLPLLILTFMRATYGMPDLTVVFTTVLTWIIWILGGYLLGTWIPFPFSMLTSIALSALWTYTPYSLTREFSLLSISPNWSNFPIFVGWYRPFSFALLFSLFLSAIILCLLWVGIKPKRLAIMIVPITLGTVLILMQPDLMVRDNEKPVCKIHSGINVCVHPAKTAAFDAINDGIEQAKKIINADALPLTLTEYDAAGERTANYNADTRSNAKEIADAVTANLYEWSSGVWQCATLAAEKDSDALVQLTDEESATEIIQFSLANKLGFSAYTDTFISEDENLNDRVQKAQKKIDAWSVEETGKFISTHRSRLRTCDPTIISDFD